MENAKQALDNIGNMADEMEQRYEKNIEKLEYEKEYFMNEMERLVASKFELQTEVNELNDVIDDMVIQHREMEEEIQSARRSFTGFQVALSMLVFVYGMLYGTYIGIC
jgi:chromosome segregation ATPase